MQAGYPNFDHFIISRQCYIIGNPYSSFSEDQPLVSDQTDDGTKDDYNNDDDDHDNRDF